MAQERLAEWNAPDKSFNLNKMFLQALPAGLYFGFDVVLGGTMNLAYNHNTTGKQFVNVNQSLTSKQGVIVSRQGIQILETDAVNLPIATTSSTARRDAIVCVHNYIETTGGQSASYSVKQNIGVGEPILLNNESLIAILELPANCTALNQVGVNYIERRKLNLDSIKAKFDSLDVEVTALENAVTSLENNKYDKELPNLVFVSDFLAGWGQPAPGFLQFCIRKDARDRVYMSGIISKISASGNPDIIVIPPTFRPASARIIPAIIAQGANFIPCGLVIQADGIIRISPNITLNVGDAVYFDGCSYFILT